MLIRARLVYPVGGSVPRGTLETSEDGVLWRELPVLGPDRAKRPAVWGVVTAGTLATAHAVLLAALGEPPESALVAAYATRLGDVPRESGWTIDEGDVRRFAAAVRERAR